MKKVMKTPKKPRMMRRMDRSSSALKDDILNLTFEIFKEASSITIDQYKILSTLLVTINGGAVITLMNLNIDAYITAIACFSGGMLFPLLLFFYSYAISALNLVKINETISLNSTSKQRILLIHTRRSTAFSICSLISFGVSVMFFALGIISALKVHKYIGS